MGTIDAGSDEEASSLEGDDSEDAQHGAVEEPSAAHEPASSSDSQVQLQDSDNTSASDDDDDADDDAHASAVGSQSNDEEQVRRCCPGISIVFLTVVQYASARLGPKFNLPQV